MKQIKVKKSQSLKHLRGAIDISHTTCKLIKIVCKMRDDIILILWQINWFLLSYELFS